MRVQNKKLRLNRHDRKRHKIRIRREVEAEFSKRFCKRVAEEMDKLLGVY